jgi:hypothetical protein
MAKLKAAGLDYSLDKVGYVGPSRVLTKSLANFISESLITTF